MPSWPGAGGPGGWAVSPLKWGPGRKAWATGAEGTKLPVVWGRPKAVIFGVRSGQRPRIRLSTGEGKLAEKPWVGVAPSLLQLWPPLRAM